MHPDVQDRIARLRGGLPLDSLGARGLERVARNPGCKRLQALTLAGLTPATALQAIYKEHLDEGQSPFAISAGNRFEQELFQDEAGALLQLYGKANRLGPEERRLADIPALVPGKRSEDLEKRQALTIQLLHQKLAGNPLAPHMILKPRLSVEILGVRHGIEPDALVASNADRFYRPVEIKSYPDRGGKTDPVDLRSACRQLAVAVIALRAAAEGLGMEDFRVGILPVGDVILRQPGSFQATLTPMLLRGELDSLERLLESMPQTLQELESLLLDGASLAQAAALDSIPNDYRESCREHCALAQRCRRIAMEKQELVILGGPAKADLSCAGNLGRTLELLHGRGPRPKNQDEQRLQARLQEVLQQYKEAMRHAG